LPNKGRFAGVWSASDQEVQGLFLTASLLENHVVEEVYDGLIAGPGVVEMKLLRGESRLDQLTSDELETGFVSEEQIGSGDLRILELSFKRTPGGNVLKEIVGSNVLF
jgi:hypothetical protein